MLQLLFRPFRCFCLRHKHWNVSPTDQWCHLPKAIWILIGQQKNFASEMRKKLNCSQLLSLRNFFARTLCELSLRMPVTYFARTFSQSFFSLEIDHKAYFPLGEIFRAKNASQSGKVRTKTVYAFHYRQRSRENY